MIQDGMERKGELSLVFRFGALVLWFEPQECKGVEKNEGI